MKTKQPDITRTKILTAAFQEIHRCGFQAASINNILADTGLTKGALYHHFPNKHALGLAVIDEVIREQLENDICLPLENSNNAIDTLLQVLQQLIIKFDEEQTKLGCPFNNLMQEMSPLDETFRIHLTSILMRLQRVIATSLSSAKQCGQLKHDVNPDAIAMFVVATYTGCVGTAKSLQSVKTFQTSIQQLMEYVRSLKCSVQTEHLYGQIFNYPSRVPVPLHL
ncbi:TetR/AcrR family transcriptional regulator [Beggiatoa leptomitoformis]|uniref:TetR family transcriptional regulator n=1 Tax=Beggiatoa leptomitoformis TaxID=288004 RepID=A0A2N9YIR7_9GAMM|nr:TetR/AcrR family transcriptional regulator [Beggiatoa leptomitoformis]ALG67395.1 TetR family transcriptional regulator [Beggiatoa leptomitoformis]AUI70394.1 TetR family transcriptional regulator [Beggiatoa leptomitoformis]